MQELVTLLDQVKAANSSHDAIAPLEVEFDLVLGKSSLRC